MADWWAQDAADPAHPEIQSSQPAQSGWWMQDAADPAFPASAVPVERPAEKTVTVDAASLPSFEPNSGLLYDPANPAGPARMLGGYAAGAVSPVVGAAQLAAHGAAAAAPETMTPIAKFTDAMNAWLSKGGSPEYNIGRNAGIYTAPVLAGPLLGAVGGAGLAGAASRIGAGAATGAGFAAATPVDSPDQDFWGQKARQVETGAATGGALPAAGAVVRASLPGPSAAVQALRQAGVEPTPGAAAGGLPGVVESLAGRVPLLGAPIQAGRAAAMDQFSSLVTKNAEDFQRGAVNRVLGRVGESLDPQTNLGHDAIAEMADKVSAAYKAAVPTAGGRLDPTAAQEIANIRANAKLLLPPDRAQQLENFIQGKIGSQLQPNGVLPGQAFKDAESDLGGEIRNIVSGNSTSDERALGNSYRQLQGTLRSWIGRVSPQNAADIANANQAYREMLPVQEAAATPMGNGQFTPQNLLAASKKFGGSVPFARGQAPMQDYAQNAALQQAQLAAAARQALSPSRNVGGHGTGIGAGVLGANLIEHLMEHPSPSTIAAVGLTYPALMGMYSNAGRSAVNNLLLSGGGRVPFSLIPFAAQYGASRPGSLPLLPGDVPR